MGLVESPAQVDDVLALAAQLDNDSTDLLASGLPASRAFTDEHVLWRRCLRKGAGDLHNQNYFVKFLKVMVFASLLHRLTSQKTCITASS